MIKEGSPLNPSFQNRNPNNPKRWNKHSKHLKIYLKQNLIKQPQLNKQTERELSQETTTYTGYTKKTGFLGVFTCFPPWVSFDNKSHQPQGFWGS